MEEILRKETRSKNHSIMAFILGLLSANNLVYAFVVGRTPILLICVYALICLIWLTLLDPFRIGSVLLAIPKSLWMFVAFALMSVVWVLIFNSGYMHQWIVGVIGLFLSLIIVFLVVALKDDISAIIKGVFLGIVINAGFAIYAFILYRRGEIFTLHEVFPAWSMPVPQIQNSFRAWGLFREPGHLMRYVAIMALVVFSDIDKDRKILRGIFIVSVMIMLIFTVSSAIAIFAVGLFLFLLLSGKSSFRKGVAMFGAVLIVLLGLFIFSRVSPTGAEIWEYFVNGLFDFSSSTENSTVRITGMKNSINIIRQYGFIGCGWNVFTKVFQEAGYYTTSVRGSYSELLSTIAELGLGALAYVVFLFSNARYNFKKKEAFNLAMGCAILIYFALFTTTDYSIGGDSAVFIGLIIATRVRGKEQEKLICN